MNTGEQLNSDLTQLVTIKSEELDWLDSEWPGISKKPFELITRPGLVRETCLYKFGSGAAMEGIGLNERVEILVIDGQLSDSEDNYAKGVYFRLPPGARVRLESKEGCVIFFRRRTAVGKEGEKTVCDTNDRSLWETWGGGGNQKIPLDDPSESNIGAWFGYMFPEHQVPEHDHVGGEEVLILHGVLEDHTGECGPGTWIRLPIGFIHSPIVHSEGVLMLVREGDVRP